MFTSSFEFIILIFRLFFKKLSLNFKEHKLKTQVVCKIIGSFFILIFSSCQNQGFQSWQCIEIPSHSGKLILDSLNGLVPIKLELARGSFGIRMTLILSTYGAIPCQDDPHATELTVSYEDVSFSFRAYLFSGGHYLLFPREVTNQLLEVFSSEKEIFFTLGFLEGKFSLLGFKASFQNLVKMPIKEEKVFEKGN